MNAETPVADLSFEAAMAELEAVVTQLDRGEVPLDQSIALYERGAALKAHCESKLKEAEEKVEQLVLNADGQTTGAKPAEGM